MASKIFGPRLEDLAREWVLTHASEQALSGRPSWVRPATLACKQHQQGHELDIVAIRSSPLEGDSVLAVGEVKATGKALDLPALERLEHLRALLPPDRVLVDMDRLYRGH